MLFRSEQDKIGVTVVSHDSEDRILVDGCEPKGCYSRQVLYTGASLKFIKYECYNTWFLGEGEAWWISRDGVKMTHWGELQWGVGSAHAELQTLATADGSATATI